MNHQYNPNLKRAKTSQDVLYVASTDRLQSEQ